VNPWLVAADDIPWFMPAWLWHALMFLPNFAKEHLPAWLWNALTCPTAWALAIGACSLWLLVPGGGWISSWPRRLGGVLAAVSALLFAVDLPTLGPLGVQVVFWLLALVTVGSAVAMISAKSPLYSALWFALSLLGASGLFFLQGAQFLGGATIVVYAGAIVVTFLFVIMLAQPEGHSVYDRVSWGWFPRPAAILAAAIFVGLLTAGLSGIKDLAESSAAGGAATDLITGGDKVLAPQHMANLGRRLFSEQLIAVEVAGTLLMAALVGAIAIAIHGKQSRGDFSPARRSFMEAASHE
jgi:NADH-quinone oxidoreductase subunit J